jgi:hypothetical protein
LLLSHVQAEATLREKWDLLNGLDDARRGSCRLNIAADDPLAQRALRQLDGEIADRAFLSRVSEVLPTKAGKQTEEMYRQALAPREWTLPKNV